MRPVSLTYTGTVWRHHPGGLRPHLGSEPHAEWLPNCVSVVPGPSNKGRGDGTGLHFERQGRKPTPFIEVIEYEPPTTFAWVEIIYRRGSKTFFKLRVPGAPPGSR